MQTIKCYTKALIQNPREFSINVLFKLGTWLPDKIYIKILFWLKNGYRYNDRKPRTFNEKLNWLKLHYRKPLFTTMVDKYAVKEYVAKQIGKEYVVENLFVANRWENIDFNKLPNQFVMKCTHDSGGAFVCKDKSTFDFEGTRKTIEKNLNIDLFKQTREWPYKNVPHRIVVDRYLDDHTGNELRDYKWWCFDGKPTYMYCTIKAQQIYENFYDMDFNPVGINHGFPRHEPEFEKPQNFELMKELAAKLSAGIPFVRVDFFDVEGKVYFGEFTFYDFGGLRPFVKEWDEKLGTLLQIPTKTH